MAAQKITEEIGIHELGLNPIRAQKLAETQMYEVRFFQEYAFSKKFDGGRLIFLPQTYLDNYDAVNGTRRCVGTNVAHCCTRNGGALATDWDR